LALANSAGELGLVPTMTGGEQELGLRAGTQNTALILAAAVAMSEHAQTRGALHTHMQDCQQLFMGSLKTMVADWHLTVPTSEEAVGIVNLWFDGIDAQSLLERIPHLCMNRGASCNGGGEKFSHVPAALGLPVEVAANVIRISFGWGADREDAERAASILANAVHGMRKG